MIFVGSAALRGIGISETHRCACTLDARVPWIVMLWCAKDILVCSVSCTPPHGFTALESSQASRCVMGNWTSSTFWRASAARERTHPARKEKSVL